ncbi:MAG: exosortase C-terminal domain/associated protein EpsI [Candidatus Krumholzibacteriota bacterium]
MNNKYLAALIALITVLIVYTYILRYREPEPAGMPGLEIIPERINGYGSRSVEMSPDALRILGSDTTLARVYSDGSDELEFFLGFFRQQQKNSQIHSPRHCYPGSGWDIIREKSMELNPGDRVIPARSMLISDGEAKRFVIYWFSINGRFITNEFALKWQQLRFSLLGRPQAAAFIRFSVILPGGREEQARADLIGLAEKLYPHIERSLRNL